MFPRLLILIVALGALGASLLALRQARLQAASEAAQAQLRIQSADEELFTLRAQVASAVTPSAVEVLAGATQHVGPLRPATNDIPIALTTNELKGLPAELGGSLPELDVETIIVEPRVASPAKTPAKTPAKAPAKKPSNPAPKTVADAQDRATPR